MAAPPPQPGPCFEIAAPVCGVKGGMKFNYANACFAAQDGAKVVSQGACPKAKAHKKAKKKAAEPAKKKEMKPAAKKPAAPAKKMDEKKKSNFAVFCRQKNGPLQRSGPFPFCYRRASTS